MLEQDQAKYWGSTGEDPVEPPDPAQIRRQAQEELRKYEEDEDIRRAEKRRLIYQDVEALIQQGFISHQIVLAGVPLAFRSLSPGDQFILKHRASVGSLRSWKLWVVASSIWMINGINLLPDTNAPVIVYEQLSGLPPKALEILFSIVIGLYNRVGLALRKTESYCYEPYSRMQWRLCGRLSSAKDAYTGIPGSEALGTNYVQRMWIAFNLAEDDRQAQIMAWQAAKLTARVTNPKGIKKLDTSDENLQKREDQRRKEAIHQMLQETLLGTTEEIPEEVVVMVRGQPLKIPRPRTARTDDDLVDEMRRWVEGEKDWHDLVVDRYKDRIREQYAAEQKQREESIAVAVEPEVQIDNLVGYTPEQIAELKPELFNKSPGVKRIFDNSAPLALYQKYIAEDPKATVPEKKPLQESLQGRKPVLGGKPITSVSRGK